MSVPQHLLMTADTVGGVWQYAIGLARALSVRGIAVTLATMGVPASAEQRAEAAQISGLDVVESRFKLEWMEQPWNDVDAAGQWLLELESQLKPDLVQLNGYAHGSLPWKAPVVIVAHSCVYSWWNAVHGHDPPPEWQVYRDRVTVGLRGATAVVAVSKFMASELARHYGCDRARVIYNGRRAEDYKSVAKEPFVLSSGRVWDEAKNLRLLDESAVSLPWPVYIAGEPHHPDGGLADLRRAQALGRVTETDLAQWMARAAVYVSPAKYEPFGFSVLEAALSGCALVLGDNPTFRELWQGAAVFVNTTDAAELTEAIEVFIANYRMRQDYAARARKRGLRYPFEAMIESYLELYSQVLSNHEAGAPCGS
jgi:glycosyltransferase involved in cell wall biosynthesis